MDVWWTYSTSSQMGCSGTQNRDQVGMASCLIYCHWTGRGIESSSCPIGTFPFRYLLFACLLVCLQSTARLHTGCSGFGKAAKSEPKWLSHHRALTSNFDMLSRESALGSSVSGAGGIVTPKNQKYQPAATCYRALGGRVHPAQQSFSSSTIWTVR